MYAIDVVMEKRTLMKRGGNVEKTKKAEIDRESEGKRKEKQKPQ